MLLPEISPRKLSREAIGLPRAQHRPGRQRLISGASVANFVLIPNDFGMVDLTGAYAIADGEKSTLHRPEGTMEFSRVTLRSDQR